MATLTGVISINQIIGPPFFKLALRLSGEAYIDPNPNPRTLTLTLTLTLALEP